MASSQVFFTNLRTTPTSNLLDKMERLVRRAGIAGIDFENRFAAIKIHFGEPGNMAYLRPQYAARMAGLLRSLGAKPFLTDANTLYSGRRANAVDHLQSAMENGYNPISAQCQVIIADGLKGIDYREIEIDGEYCKAPKIGAAVADADIVISMTHFKGHEQTGFGGTLKNLGMGCASVGGKLELHCAAQPVVKTENCRGCNICVKHCAHDAIHLNPGDISLQNDPVFLCFRVRDRNSGKKCLGIRVKRVLVQTVLVSLLNKISQIHNTDTVTDMLHNT